MIELLDAKIDSNKWRVGTVVVKYYDITLCCDICLYKEERLFIRMPEMRIRRPVGKKNTNLSESKPDVSHEPEHEQPTKNYVRRFVFWDDKAKSDEFQKIILKKACDRLRLTVQVALNIRATATRPRKVLARTDDKR